MIVSARKLTPASTLLMSSTLMPFRGSPELSEAVANGACFLRGDSKEFACAVGVLARQSSGLRYLGTERAIVIITLNFHCELVAISVPNSKYIITSGHQSG